MPHELELIDLAATDRIAAICAARFPKGTVVELLGTLGAGKTRFVQAFGAACGIERDDITSPTFVLCREYRGSRRIFHLDAYRLRDEDEFRELGPEEFFTSDAVAFIEWADRVPNCLPRRRFSITLEVTGETSRRCTIAGYGSEHERIAGEIAAEFSRTAS